MGIIAAGSVEEVSQSPSGGMTGSPYWSTNSSKSIMYEEHVCASGWKALEQDRQEEREVHRAEAVSGRGRGT